MASFIQPGTYAPDNASDQAAVSPGRFLIYTNSIVPADEILSHWYQFALLIGGCSLFGLALLRPLCWWVLKEVAKWRKTDEPRLIDELADFTRSAKDVAQQQGKAFGQFIGGDLNTFFQRDYDLYLMDLTTYRSRQFLPPRSEPSFSITASRRRSTVAQIGTLGDASSSRRGSTIVNPYGYTPDQLRRLSTTIAASDRKNIMAARGSSDRRGSLMPGEPGAHELVDLRRESMIPGGAQGLRKSSLFPGGAAERGSVDLRKASLFPGSAARRGSVDPRKGSLFPGTLDPFSADLRRGSLLAAGSRDMRRGSSLAGDPQDTSRGSSLAVDPQDTRRGSILAGVAPDMRRGSVLAGGSRDMRRGSILAGAPQDMRRGSLLAVGSQDLRRGSLLAVGPQDLRRGSLFPKPSNDLRRTSVMATSAAADARKASVAAGATPDFRKFSTVVWGPNSKPAPVNESTMTSVLRLPHNVWILVDRSVFYGTGVDGDDVAQTLRAETENAGIGGLVIDSRDFDGRTLRRVCNECLYAGLDVMLLEDSDTPTTAPVYPLVAGVVFRNAAILPNGNRRDFFQATKLRTALARCKMQQKTREEFFVGFLDLWHTKPQAAVVRRANKVAKFYNAVLHQAASDELQNSISKPVADCLSAFDIIKSADIIRAQGVWLGSALNDTQDSLRQRLSVGFASLTSDHKLASLAHPFRSLTRKDSGVSVPSPTVDVESPPSYVSNAPPRTDFWMHSSQNRRMCDYGCYDIREELFDEQYEAVVNTQRHLRRLGLLEQVQAQELINIANMIAEFSRSPAAKEMNDSGLIDMIDSLIQRIKDGSVVVYRGLDSGFRLPDNQGHFWAVSHEEKDTLQIFVSLKAPEVASVIIHTFLAHYGIPRRTRLLLESNVARDQAEPAKLPQRIAKELKSATYSELLFMLEQINISGAEDSLCSLVQQECQRLLIQEPTRVAFITLQCNDLLAGRATIREVLQARLDLLAKAGRRDLPDLQSLVEAAIEMDTVLQRALFENDDARLKALAQPIVEAYAQSGAPFHPSVDLYALIFFISLRKHAFEEVYLETTDRCPLFLQQRDQAGVFAEMWALGSQCEIYFGIKPRGLGAVIYDRYRAYLEANPPTTESSKIAELFTAYQNIEGVDNDNAVITIGPRTWKQRWNLFKKQFANATFLTVFCVPAIVDVCLLTFLGRGLYLTAFMSREERLMANYAVLAALIMTAGVTGWTGSSGGFYLHTAAFNNMTHFMVQRVSGGFVIALIFAICAFVAFGIEYTWYAGFVFAAYLIVLSTYLNILGVLTTMHRNNSPFLSGRTVLLSCMLITLISPILTCFVNGHDVLVYLLVLYFFLGVLIYSWLRLSRSWITWMEHIHLISEKEIMSWYQSQPSTGMSENLPKHLQRSQASTQLMAAIKSFDPKKKMSRNDDPLVAKIAKGHEYAVFMLKQDDPMSELPEPYGPTWLTKMKLALENQRALAHGLKEHSPFLLFRKAKYDIAQNVGFFLVVLMDRWVAVSMSANGHVINLYYDVRSRYGIAFGLLYFLICAVSLDIVLQRYWGKTGRTSASKLATLAEFDQAEEADSRLGRLRWLSAIYELTSIMVGVFGFSTIFVWLLAYRPRQIILYLAYISGYSGALIFQFNRVFTTNIKYHVQLVFASSAIGYLAGILLHAIPATRDFMFSDVIAMNIASLLSAFSTWLFSDFTADAKVSAGESSQEDAINWKTYSQKLIGNPETDLQAPIRPPRNFGTELRFEDENSLSQGIRARFSKAMDQINTAVIDAFEDYQAILEQTLSLWEDGSIRLFVIPRKEFIEVGGAHRFAFSKIIDDVLTIVVGMPSFGRAPNASELTAQIVAEALLHETCEGAMQMRHAHATLAELLLNEDEPISTRMAVQLAETSPSDLSRIISNTNEELLTHLCLGVNPDITWEQTPETVRSVIISRIMGTHHTVSPVLEQWLLESSDSLVLRQLALKQCLAIRALALWRLTNGQVSSEELPPNKKAQVLWQKHLSPDIESKNSTSRKTLMRTYVFFFRLVEFIAVITTAGSDAGRELWVSLPNNRIRFYILWPLLKFWKLCFYLRNVWMYAIIFSLDEDYKKFNTWTHRGGSRVLKKGRVVVDDPLRPETGFFKNAGGKIQILHYQGTHSSRPDKEPHLITTYDEDLRLRRATHVMTLSKGFQEAERIDWLYQFDSDTRRKGPIFKFSIQNDQEIRQYYDEVGRVVSGEMVNGGDRVEFSYLYKPQPKESHHIIRAVYTTGGQEAPTTWEVYWSNTGDFDSEDTTYWTPSERVTRLVKKKGDSLHQVFWRYDHKRDPFITRTSSPQVTDYNEGNMVELEAMRLGLLTKPSNNSYFDENLLLKHSKVAILSAVPNEDDEPDSSASEASKESSKAPLMSRLGARNDGNISTVHYPLPTFVVRTALWKHWLSHPAMSAVVACNLDEMMLRHERSLRRYWSYRDAGRFLEAKEHLADHLVDILPLIEIADDVAQRVHLCIRPGDLFEMGLSKDSNYIINTPEEAYIDTDNRLAVIFTDTGCWPDAPGGVSNCRRDLVDGHKTIRNYAVTEGAYDWAVPRFQAERNIQLMQNLPLWGLDGKTPVHGLFDNLLQSEVDDRARVTSSRNIKEIFVPILKRIIKGARTKHNTLQDLKELTLCFLRINEYFETNDFSTTWRSSAVKRAFREAWLHEHNDPNIHSFSTLFPMERPTRQDFEETLELYIGYFFIFSIRIPEHVPRVYQSTHHGISSLWGMCLKLRRGTAWGIWDHAILWRESCLNISTAQCFLPIPVQNMLLGAMKVAAHLAYLHADIILPCTDTFNPGWEIELGTDQGCLASRNLMARKIDPITNGIANMSAFTPVKKIRTSDPTCVMLSNVQFIKDVKNAIQAAGVIINDFGFKSYNLVVYGAQDRQPSYAVETEELIASLGIGGTVRLGGFGSPKEVLKDAWLFMNSSLSEGLPLAIGEAALAGIPIVATEVGATAQVLTDVDDPSIRYGEIVSPNDPVALARAQIAILAMLGPWAKYTKDDKPPPPMPSKFAQGDVEWITARMHEKTEDRRALGLKLREVVQRKFSGDRYLREHEQMYWIQRHMAEQRADAKLEQLAALHPKFNQPLAPRFVEFGRPEWTKSRWQDFAEPTDGKDQDEDDDDDEEEGYSEGPRTPIEEKKAISWFSAKRKARQLSS